MAAGFIIWWREGRKVVSELCTSSAEGDAAMARFYKKKPESGIQYNASSKHVERATLDKISVTY